MVDKELKPCPFCGGEATVRLYETSQVADVYCANDGCEFQPEIQHSDYGTKEKVAKAWNTRPAPLPKEREEALGDIETALKVFAKPACNCQPTGEGFFVCSICKAIDRLPLIRTALSKPNDELTVQDAKAITKLFKERKYIQGIVERGENRVLDDEESLPDAVLNYVKKLEAKKPNDVDVDFKSTMKRFTNNSNYEVLPNSHDWDICEKYYNHLKANGYLGGVELKQPYIVNKEGDIRQLPKVPEGYALVPIEPTENIINAGWDCMEDVVERPDDYGRIYKAMIKAATEKNISIIDVS